MTKRPQVDAALLYPSWRRLGIAFTGHATTTPVDVELLIIETATAAAADERLTVCAASWLASFHAFVDGRRLSECARAATKHTQAYLGAILSLAQDSPDGCGNAPQFTAALSHCMPLTVAQPLYDIAGDFPAHRSWMKAKALPIFQQWNLWHDDASLQRKSLHKLETIITVPELRARALMGPSLEAACLAITQSKVTTARSLAKTLNATYAAVHGAVSRLVDRGLVTRTADGVRQELRLTDFAKLMFV
jgi:hypothetical protein